MIRKNQFLIRSTIVVAVLFFLIISPLVAAALQATYLEESNPIVKNNGDYPLDFNFSNYKVSFRVGTVTIRSVDGEDPPSINHIKLDRSDCDNEKSELVATEGINGVDEFYAMLVARITYGDSKTKVVLVEKKNQEHLLETDDLKNCANPFPITIEFFMVMNLPNATIAEGIGFQFELGHGPGNFQLETNGLSNLIPIDGITDPSIFMPPEYTVGLGSSYINIEGIDTTWDASLSIDQTTTGDVFDLYNNLCTNMGALVGVADITLNGYSGHSGYSVNISFADNRNGQGEKYFYLKHEDMDSFIPFTLYLAGSELHNGQALPWTGLEFPPNTNLKDIHAKVDYQTALSKIAGEYSDTITATITPIETL